MCLLIFLGVKLAQKLVLRSHDVKSMSLYLVNSTAVLVTKNDLVTLSAVRLIDEKKQIKMKSMWNYTLYVPGFITEVVGNFNTPSSIAVANHSLFSMKTDNGNTSLVMFKENSGSSYTVIKSGFESNSIRYHLSLSADEKSLFLTQQYQDFSYKIFSFDISGKNTPSVNWETEKLLSPSKAIDVLATANDGIFVPFVNSSSFNIRKISKSSETDIILYDKQYKGSLVNVLLYSSKASTMFACLDNSNKTNSLCAIYQLKNESAEIIYVRENTNPTYYTFDASANTIILEPTDTNKKTIQAIPPNGDILRVPSLVSQNLTSLHLVSAHRKGIISFAINQGSLEFHFYQCERGLFGINWFFIALAGAGVFLLSCLIIGICCCLCQKDQDGFEQV